MPLSNSIILHNLYMINVTKEFINFQFQEVIISFYNIMYFMYFIQSHILYIIKML